MVDRNLEDKAKVVERAPMPWAVEVLGSTVRVVSAAGDDVALCGDMHEPQSWADARFIVAAAQAYEGAFLAFQEAMADAIESSGEQRDRLDAAEARYARLAEEVRELIAAYEGEDPHRFGRALSRLEGQVAKDGEAGGADRSHASDERESK